MKKTKLRKKAKTKTNSWYRKECVELAKKIVKHLAGYKCQFTGSEMRPPCYKSADFDWKMEGSHIKNEGRHHSMSADTDNILCLCSDCHRWWHANPDESGKWFRETFPELAEKLDERARMMQKINWKQRHEEIKETWNSLIN